METVKKVSVHQRLEGREGLIGEHIRKRRLWLHNMSQDRLVQESGLNQTAPPHKKAGRLRLMWTCTSAGTSAVSQKL